VKDHTQGPAPWMWSHTESIAALPPTIYPTREPHAMSTTWADPVRITIPGQPIPKGRPRVAVRGRRAVAYTPARTKTYEARVAWAVANVTRSELLAPAGVPVRFDALVVFGRPQRLQAKRHPAGLIPHTCRPDLDNVVKALMDGVGAAGYWADDSQVTCLRADAAYAERGQDPRVEITLWTLAG